MAKFIFDLPNEQLLPATISMVEKLEAFSDLAKVEKDPADVIPPAIREEGETDEQFQERKSETAKRKWEISKKHLFNVVRKACLEHPKETAAFSDSFWMPEKAGEKLPNAIITLNTIMGRGDVLHFFVSLKSLA